MCRLAHAFQPAVWDSQAHNIGASDGRWVPGAWPDAFWHEPETGTVMLMPSVLRKDFNEDSAWAPFMVALSQLRWAIDTAGTGLPYDYFEEFVSDTPAQPRIIALKRPAPATTAIKGLEDEPSGSGSIDQNLQDFGLIGEDMCWACQTTFNLKVNEGFCISIRPYGIDTDCAKGWYAIAFGQIWIIMIGMNGHAELWERTKSRAGGTAATWILREKFEFSPGDPQGGKPFRMSVIPWGIDGIGIYFSQSPTAGQKKRAQESQEQPHGYLYRINAHRDGTPTSPYTRYKDALKGFEKTLAGPVSIGMRRTELAYSFAMARIRYKGDTLTLAAEQLDMPRRYIPTANIRVDFVGYNYGGDFPGVFMRETTFGAVTAWTPATDYRMVIRTAVTPGDATAGIGTYSPEIWACEADISATATVIPADAETDISDKWSSIHFTLSSRMEPTSMNIKFRDERFRNWFKQDSGAELIIDGKSLFVGQIQNQRKALEGGVDRLMDPESAPSEDNLPRSTQVLQTELPVENDWQRLNFESAGNASSFTSKTVGDIFEKALNRAGIPDTDIAINAELYSIALDNWDEDYAHRTPKDFKVPSEDASWADVCREVARCHSLQERDGIRLYPIGRKWYGGVVREFDPEASPKVVFYYHSDALPTEVRDLPDTDRWAGVEGVRFFKILSGEPTSLDLTINKAQFNSLSVFGATSSGSPSQSLAAFIAPDSREIDDVDFIEHTGQQVHRTIGPQECALCVTPNEIERFARHKYDEEQRRTRDIAFDGEWQPVRDASDLFVLTQDQEIWIIGLAPYAIGEIQAGQKVSFGVWRISMIGVTIEHDYQTAPRDFDDEDDEQPPTQSMDNTFDWHGAYCAQYVGVHQTADYPMFTDLVPLFGRPADWPFP